MKIEISKIEEVLPDVLSDRNPYFFEKLMSRVTYVPFRIEKMEVQELLVSELANELLVGFNSKEIFSVVPMHGNDSIDEMHLFLLDEEVLVLIMFDFLTVSVYAGYNDLDALNTPLTMLELRNFLEPYSERNISNKGRVNLMCMMHNELTTKQFKLPPSAVDLETHYNEGMQGFHEKVVSVLNGKKSNGIIFLHGKPGTGKTTYIRYLISQIDRKVIFVPSDMVTQLGRPDFMQFMLQNKNSVIIIEDAESVLEDRASARNSVVSNLLNLSDGILSDALKIQFVCTFNTDINRIDEAFFRGGRMIAMHEFKPLEESRANVLAKSLGVNKEFYEPVTLADIYNDLGEMRRDSKKGSIGFNRK